MKRLAQLAMGRRFYGRSLGACSHALRGEPTLQFRLASGASHGVNAEDFVDIDLIAGYGAFMGSSSDATTALPSPVLGVLRTPEEKEGTEYSRLHIPLEQARAGHPPERANSRAAVSAAEATADEETVCGAEALTGPQGVSSTADAQQSESALETEGAGSLVDDDIDALHRLPELTSLPYDDEKFAETLLEMEVDGAIDEAWQDGRRAHQEDVKEIAEILRTMKVRDICCIDVSSKTSNFDYMMFGTCEGSRHIHLAAWAAQEADSRQRLSKVRRKHLDELWEVVPIGRIVLNLMVESLREELTLERKWAVTRTMDPLAAANAPISEGRQVRAHGLWTLTLNLQDLEDFEVDYCKDVLMGQA